MSSPYPASPVELVAALIQPGTRLVLQDGSMTAPTRTVTLIQDDFGNAALQVLTMEDESSYRVAIGARVRAITAASIAAAERTAALVRAGALRIADPVPQAGSHVPPPPARYAPRPEVLEALSALPGREVEDEELLQEVAETYPSDAAIFPVASRLAKGVHAKSGSTLADLRVLAERLYLTHDDPVTSLDVMDILNRQALDDNPARWNQIEVALAMSAFIADELGQPERADAYRVLLKAPLGREADPFRARMQERLHLRRLEEPSLYDKEIFRAMDHGQADEERDWRVLRLESLLHLLAHGGSKAMPVFEVGRRIEAELEVIRG